MREKFLLPAFILLLTACSGSGYKTPGMDKAPAKMSADTLCFRYASSKDPALGKEIDARNIDCTALLREDPFYTHDLDPAHRMGR